MNLPSSEVCLRWASMQNYLFNNMTFQGINHSAMIYNNMVLQAIESVVLIPENPTYDALPVSKSLLGYHTVMIVLLVYAIFI